MTIPHDSAWAPCPDTAIGSLRTGSGGGGAGPVAGASTDGEGAGRSLDLTFPVPIQTTTAVGGGTTSVITRQGVVQNGLAIGAAAPGVNELVVYKGRVANRITAYTGLWYTATTPFWMQVNTLTEGPEDSGDFACYRVRALLAFEWPGAAGDLGCWLSSKYGNNTVLNGFTPGLALRPISATTVHFYAKPAESLVFGVSEDLAAVLDVTDYNAYEYRLIGGAAGRPAVVKVLINNVLLGTYPFDGSLPPLGLQINVGSLGGGRVYVPMCGVNIAAAATEAALR